MAGTTTEYDLPYPTSGDPPKGDEQIAALAQGVNAELVAEEPADHSVTLTGADVRLVASDVTTILTAAFTLPRDSWVLVGGQTRVLNSGGAIGTFGIFVDVDGVFDADLTAGPGQVDYQNDGIRTHLTILPKLLFLAAGAHSLRLRGDRNGVGTLDAAGSVAYGTPSHTYKPTRILAQVIRSRP